MKHVYIMAAACILALAGCAGGSGGNAGSSSIVAAEVAQRLGGLSVPTSTADEVEAGIKTIANSANTLVLSDSLYFLNVEGLPPILRFRSECAGDSCEQVEPLGERFEVTIEDFRADDRGLGTISADPIGRRHGIVMAAIGLSDRLQTGEPLSIEGYGGWMEYGAFIIARGEIEDGQFAGSQVAFSSSFGDSPSTIPTIGASWTGVVAGTDTSLGETGGNIIQGQARIDLESLGGIPVVDVAFTELYDLDTEESRGALSWQDLEVTENGFTDGTSLDGRFYGPNHEEAAGVFERDDILGAFGATRQ